MNEILKLNFGVVFLLLGILIGNFLAKITKEELKQGKKWFKLIFLAGFLGGVVGLAIQDDVLMFSMFFISIVTYRSLKN